MKDKILEWFSSGEVGASSKAMACAVMGTTSRDVREGWSCHPCDPDDLRRCVSFLKAVPEARDCFYRVSSLSGVWARLIEKWDTLEALLEEEMSKGNKAPKTYKIMKELGC